MSGRLAVLDTVFLFTATMALTLFQTTARGEGIHHSMLAVVAQSAIVAAACLAVFYFAGVYETSRGRSLGRLARQLAGSITLMLGVMAVLFVSLLPPKASHPRFAFRVAIIVTLFVALRTLFYFVSGLRRERLLILGLGPLVYELLESLRKRNVTVGLVADGRAVPARPLRHAIVGSLAHLPAVVDQFKPHRIIVALTERRGCLGISDLVDRRVEGVVVEHGIDAYERLTGRLAIESMTPSSLVFGSGFAPRRLYPAVARAGSLLTAVVALVAVAPLLGVIAALIKLDSPGPVFFLHDRVGLRGRPFRLVKFRTMREATESRSEWVRDNMRRITRVGRWLRMFRLDEIPQLVNVLRGDMNLVGPRPHPVSNYELFQTRIPYYRLRSVVKPGITGWAQVQYGYANSLAEEAEKMRYDLYYIKHQSPALDFRILADTIKVVFARRGASSAMHRGGLADGPRVDQRDHRFERDRARGA